MRGHPWTVATILVATCNVHLLIAAASSQEAYTGGGSTIYTSPDDVVVEPPPASDEEDVSAIWDQFAETCPAVAAADDPVAFATSIDPSAEVRRSADGLIESATLSLGVGDESLAGVDLYILADQFQGGRLVRCVLEARRFSGLRSQIVEIVRSEAASLLGGDRVEVAGGQEIRSEEAPFEFEAEELRLSTSEFPPRAVLRLRTSTIGFHLMLERYRAEP